MDLPYGQKDPNERDQSLYSNSTFTTPIDRLQVAFILHGYQVTNS